jgi:hypothetical protein
MKHGAMLTNDILRPSRGEVHIPTSTSHGC